VIVLDVFTSIILPVVLVVIAGMALTRFKQTPVVPSVRRRCTSSAPRWYSEAWQPRTFP